MGEIADDILNGIFCCECGCIMEDYLENDDEIFYDPPGYPRKCKDCLDDK